MNKGEIATGILVTIGVTFAGFIAGSYAFADRKASEVNTKIDTHITNDRNIYERIGSMETKMDLLLKVNGVDPKQIK